MMCPDEEPSIERTPSKNNLINEAFNLNSNFSSLNIQPLTVLPPSSNHFQPISHSRTPSMEVKDLKLSAALKPPPSNSFSNSASNTPQIKTPNSFLDQSSTSSGSNLPSISLTNPLKSPVTNILSSMVQPTTNLPPPPTSSNPTVNGSSNPYAAKGALNKKVYDIGIINVAPVVPQTNFLATSPPLVQPSANFPQPTLPQSTATLNSSQSTQSLFMPPPTATSTFQQPNIPTSQSYQFPSQQMQSGVDPQQQYQQQYPQQAYDQQQYPQQSYDQQQSYENNTVGQRSTNAGVWNWISQNKLVNTFVEKAKIGVESFVTTVDPQMSNYNHPANRPLYLLSSISTPKVVNTIKDAFNVTGFSKISINAIDAQNLSQFAPQIIGYPCALQAAKEKIDYSLELMKDSECTIIAIQDFITELTTDCWFEMAIIILKDKRKNIELTVYTEAAPVSLDDIYQLQQYTPADYNLRWSGLACRLPEKNFNFNAVNTHKPSSFLNYETQDTIISSMRLTNALKTLAALFKNKMLAQI